MKGRLSIAFALLFALLASGSGQAGGSHPKRSAAAEQLRQAHEQFIAVTAKGDADGMAQLIADDYFVTGADGRTADRAGALAQVKQNRAQVEMKEDDVNVRLLGSSGVVTGLIRWKVGTGEKAATGQVRFTEVWVRRKGRWQLAIAQATAVQSKAEEKTGHKSE
ncbi:MAG TPA: nuclear transport factor 2 family protein [Blastocatellia bacterium]|nr:nuclear transport factor 2 family protein [Blastocatellia bacterium]